MDVYKALSELYAEKKRLDVVISALENRVSVIGKPDKVRGRRGRRSMSADEREEVSRRMSRYWASRRARTLDSAPQDSRGSGVPGFPVSASHALELV